jgi:hypothetical protein
MGRRDFLGALTAAALVRHVASAADGEEKLPPVRAITRGPKFHWFSYYDKLEFDPTGRYVLGMEVDFEHRSPRGDDVIKVGMVDLMDSDRWIELGESRAWNWQQGCMLQWLPGSKTEVIFNDRKEDRFVSHILDVQSGKKRSVPHPIYAVSPDARWAVNTDFRRLNDTRPGYGYAGLPDPNRDKLAPDKVGISKIDLATGKETLLVSIADITRFPDPDHDWKGAKHWLNHLLVAPDGSRFIFLHRWRGPSEKSWSTRMLTINADGKDMFVVNSFGMTSHFIWRDPTHILAWARHPSHGDRFYLFTDKSDSVEVVGKEILTEDGHCTYLPGKKWILNDTYPDKARLQHPHLFNVTSGKRYPLGHFHSPPAYAGEWRCDTHPRISPDGRKVVIDSPHGGNGRQLHLIDLAGIVEK